MARGFFLAVLAFFGAVSACSPQSAQSDSSPACSFSEVYKKDGWTVPGIGGAKPTGERARLNSLPSVFVTILTPVESETELTNVRCSRDHPGRIEVEDLPIRILDLRSFDQGGRVFAYRLFYGRESLLGDGTRADVGSASAIFFYDIDGSGRFKVVMGAKYPTGFMTPAFIPDWAKNSGAPEPVK